MAGTYSDYNASMGNQRLLGSFSKISTYYFNANMRIPNNRGYQNAPYSAIGVLFYNDREGKYLNRTRMYLSYVWHAHVSKNLSISGGFHAGGMNYSVKGTDLSGDGSDIVPDGTLGFQMYNDLFFVGISYSQMFRSKVQPIEEIAHLLPYFNTMAGMKVNISSDFKLKPDVLVRITSHPEKYDISFNTMGIWQDKVAFGVGLHANNSIVNTFELRNLTDRAKGLNISLSYGFPYKKTGIVTRFMEIGLSYNMNRGRY